MQRSLKNKKIEGLLNVQDRLFIIGALLAADPDKEIKMTCLN
jgi:hypothetical protein